MTSTLLLVLLLAATAVRPPPTAVAHPEATPTKDELYAFAYAVDAPEHENFQDRQEARLGEETRGRFRVALPDNRLQTVLYRADDRGFSAHISYDQHPDFSSLRETIGPIGKAPEIGQSVLASIRRGENWKNHKDHKDGRHPEHPSRHASHGALDNTVLPTAQPTTQRQRPSRVSRPPPTRSGPSSSLKTALRRPTTRRTSTRRPSSTPTSAPVAQRLTATASPSRRPATTGGTSTPSINDPTSLLVSPEDYEDPEILNRLIEAIRLKVAEEGLKPTTSDEDSHEKTPHRRYSIGDKASVLSRLRAVVHAVHLAHHHAK